MEQLVRLSRSQAREANRRALLDATRELVARDGASVRVEAIAMAAELTTGSIYSIFGSKNNLLVALLADEMSRDDIVRELSADRRLSLAAVIDRYVEAWFGVHGDDSKAQTALELQILLSALADERLLDQLTDALNSDIQNLTLMLEDRVVDVDRPAERTSPATAALIARALRALLTGFGLHQVVLPDSVELARRSCRALVSLAREPVADEPGERGSSRTTQQRDERVTRGTSAAGEKSVRKRSSVG